MISNMQYPREMYGKGGLTSLKEARNLLEKYALPGESLAYINEDESKYLRYMGGAGIPINSSGIPSYISLKKLFKPVAKLLNKIVPDFIKPALPFLAAAVPVFGPGLSATLAAMTPFQLAAVSAGANLTSQLSQKGAAERGINPLSLGLSALGGYAAGSGLQAPGTFGVEKIAGNLPPGALENLSGIDSLSQLGYAGGAASTPITVGGLANLPISQTVGLNPNTVLEAYQASSPTFTQQLQNVIPTTQEVLGTITRPGMQNIENIASKPFSEVTSGELLSAAKLALPGQAGAVGDLAYNAAADALDEYNKQQAALGAMGVANTEGRKAAIRRAMGLSGYTEPEIESTILKFNFANGGRVGYQLGGGTKPPSMPMNPDMLAMAIFGKSYDQLTYTQKSAIADMLPNKKAEGGIMDLGGLEMDLRAKGGFVPIGGKEKADDVPARLSKNEFVFTADAVRGAGKGDIKKGAKKMYQLMKQYEAIA
jgi:hypothetical protein